VVKFLQLNLQLNCCFSGKAEGTAYQRKFWLASAFLLIHYFLINHFGTDWVF